MIKLLKYDLMHIIRGNIYLIIMFAVIYGSNYALYLTPNEKYDIMVFDIWSILILFLSIDLLSKGVSFNIFSDFPVSTFFILKYFRTKFLVLTSIFFSIYLVLLKIFSHSNIFLLIPFFVLATYFTLSYYFTVCLYLAKTTRLKITQVLILILLLILLYLIYYFLFSIISYWVSIPIMIIPSVFNYFTRHFAKYLSPIVYEILEDSNASN